MRFEHDLLTAKEERELARAMQSDDSDVARAARSRFVACNLRLVARAARRCPHRSVPLDDLIQSGVIGLIRAVGKFDPALGYKFSSYAMWHIKREIMMEVAEFSNVIRLNISVHDRRRRVRKLQARHLAEYGELPTVEQLVDAMNQNKTADWLERPSSIKMLLGLGETGSLDAPVMDDKTLLDFVPTPLVPDGLEEGDRRAVLMGAMERVLCEREIKIVCLRYGLNDGIDRTYAEIGEMFGFSKERARQIEVGAREKLAELEQLQQLYEES